MIFKKKKMVDVRELQKKGILSPTEHKPIETANKEGFVDFSKKEETSAIATSENAESPASVFGFMDSSSRTDTFSTETNGYNRREVDEKIEQLDNKIYKLEQRVELLERKAGIQSSSGNSPAGLW